MTLVEFTNDAIQAWLSAVQQISTNGKLPKIEEAISVAEFQQAFKVVKENTSSSPSGLHYFIWKVVICDDDLAE